MNTPKILVTGGCGYIGSHTMVDLINHGFEVISIDNFSNSSPDVLQGIKKILNREIQNYNIDICDKTALYEVIDKHRDIQGIIHFAALKSVPESVERPVDYYRNNMVSLYNILDSVAYFKIPNFVFSSSCSVYGNVEKLPVSEQTPMGEAQCPYARTKQHGEEVITDFVASNNAIKAILLRYFNPVGAHSSAQIGELPNGIPNNLVPFITQTAIGKLNQLTVYGNDYATRDGSCIRDYIHVMDIAHAHTLAISHLLDKKTDKKTDIFNLGTGNGVTVFEVIKAFESSTGVKLNYQIGARRPGDIEAVYANNDKAKKVLGWSLHYDLNDMMKSAWEWQKKWKG
jgi:UDP-glucose 4-epimerase